MIDYGPHDVFGVSIDAVDLEAAVERIMFFADQRHAYKVSALAVHGIVEASRDPRLRSALNDFDLVLPDGQPVRWALNAALRPRPSGQGARSVGGRHAARPRRRPVSGLLLRQHP